MQADILPITPAASLIRPDHQLTGYQYDPCTTGPQCSSHATHTHRRILSSHSPEPVILVPCKDTSTTLTTFLNPVWVRAYVLRLIREGTASLWGGLLSPPPPRRGNSNDFRQLFTQPIVLYVHHNVIKTVISNFKNKNIFFINKAI